MLLHWKKNEVHFHIPMQCCIVRRLQYFTTFSNWTAYFYSDTFLMCCVVTCKKKMKKNCHFRYWDDLWLQLWAWPLRLWAWPLGLWEGYIVGASWIIYDIANWPHTEEILINQICVLGSEPKNPTSVYQTAEEQSGIFHNGPPWLLLTHTAQQKERVYLQNR